LDPKLGRGCYTRDLSIALKNIGFDIGSTWHRIAAANAPDELEKQFAVVHKDLTIGVSSILCMHYDDRPNTSG
jgi:hypothetical protein